MCAHTLKRTTFFRSLHLHHKFALEPYFILHFCHDVDPLIPFSFSDSESFGHGVLVLVNPSSKDVQLQVVCAITRMNKQLVWKF